MSSPISLSDHFSLFFLIFRSTLERVLPALDTLEIDSASLLSALMLSSSAAKRRSSSSFSLKVKIPAMSHGTHMTCTKYIEQNLTSEPHSLCNFFQVGSAFSLQQIQALCFLQNLICHCRFGLGTQAENRRDVHQSTHFIAIFHTN